MYALIKDFRTARKEKESILIVLYSFNIPAALNEYKQKPDRDKGMRRRYARLFVKQHLYIAISSEPAAASHWSLGLPASLPRL